VLVAVGWHGEFARVDMTTRTVLTTRSDLPPNFQAAAAAPDGTVYAGTHGGDIYRLDPLTGDTTAYLRPSDLGAYSIVGMTFSPAGDLYISSWENPLHQPGDGIWKMNVATGSLSFLGVLQGGASVQGIGFSPGGELYGIRPYQSEVGAYDLIKIDLSDFQTSLVHSGGMCGANQSVEFAPDGSLYAAGANTFVQLDPVTGQVIGSPLTVPGDFRGLAVVVPEPSSLILLGIGALGVLGYAWRRRQA
jgi:outer membrane protein assembly factor BamB